MVQKYAQLGEEHLTQYVTRRDKLRLVRGKDGNGVKKRDCGKPRQVFVMVASAGLKNVR